MIVAGAEFPACVGRNHDLAVADKNASLSLGAISAGYRHAAYFPPPCLRKGQTLHSSCASACAFTIIEAGRAAQAGIALGRIARAALLANHSTCIFPFSASMMAPVFPGSHAVLIRAERRFQPVVSAFLIISSLVIGREVDEI